uniref:Cytochrome-b5 reductase n=1 Tax=Strongyloides papillosus TaxID=174720 RepID=A0A0N5CB39_STREA
MNLSIPTPKFLKKGDRTTKDGRNKVELKPGRSLNDWIHKANARKNPFSEFNSVTLEELSKHNNLSDCWIVINGKVFDVTEYLEYHPGGISEIVNYGGKDATEAFIDIHAWINYNGFLKNYCVGTFKGKFPKISKMESLVEEEDMEREQSKTIICEKQLNFVKASTNTIHITSALWKTLEKNCFSYFVENDKLNIKVKDYKDSSFSFNYEPYSKLCDSQLKISCLDDKVIVESDIPLPLLSFNQHKWIVKKNPPTEYLKGKIIKKEKITHDMFHFSIALPKDSYIGIPVGHHVALRLLVRNNKISRPYTPISINENVIDFLIKIYSDGLLTPCIENLEKEDFIEISDGIGKLDFVRGDKNNKKCLCIAAGSGLTPMIRIIEDRIKKGTFTRLLLFNKKIEDIIPDKYFPLEDKNFAITNILSNEIEIGVDKNNKMMSGAMVGRINEKFFENIVDIKEYQILICGPWNFTNLTEEILEKLNVDKTQVHIFDG